MRKLVGLTLFLLAFNVFAGLGYDKEKVKNNAFLVIKEVVSKSHPEFHPKSVKDIQILRHERNGVIDFTYTSENGKFRGNVYCQISQLIKYSEKYSNPREVCFRSNIHEYNEEAINGFGNQVGIY